MRGSRITSGKERPATFFFRDTLLSGISVAMVVGANQLFLYPYFARILDERHFGAFLTTMGIGNYWAIIVGNTASNVCLRYFGILKGKESQRRLFASGAYLVLLASSLAAIIAGLLSAVVSTASLTDSLLIGFLVVLTSARAFAQTEYRTRLAFGGLLIYSAVLGLSLVAYGLLMPRLSPILPFVFSELTALGFGLISNRRIRILPKPTSGYRRMQRGFLQLGVANLGPTMFSYGDRWILSKFVGAEVVGSYYAATVTGKLSVTGIGIVSAVLLSYLSRVSRAAIHRRLRHLYFSAILVLLAAFVILRLASPLFMKVFYPDIMAGGLPLVPLIAVGYAFYFVDHIIRVFLVRYSNLKILSWSDLIFGIGLLVFGGIGAILWKAMGFVALFATTIGCKTLFDFVFAVITLTSKSAEQKFLYHTLRRKEGTKRI